MQQTGVGFNRHILDAAGCSASGKVYALHEIMMLSSPISFAFQQMKEPLSR